jgi:hypothetical protein
MGLRAFAWVIVSTAAVAGATPRFPAQIEKEAPAALDATRRATIHHREPWERVKEFDAALDTMAALLTPELEQLARGYEGEDIVAKLVAIAAHRRDRPEMYQEMIEVYVKPQPPIARGLPARPQLAKPEHLTAEHRLAWEYYVLRPRAGRWRYREICIGATAEEKTVQSIITIGEMCQLRKDDLSGAADSSFEGEQMVTLNALTYLPHHESLRAILTCVRLHHDLVARINPRATAYIPAWKPEDYVMRLFRTKPSPYDYSVDQARWRPIIESFPRQGLDPVELALLDQLVAFYRERDRTAQAAEK